MVSASPNLVTIGRACELLHTVPACVRAAAERAGVRPALIINSRIHYAEGDVERIREALAAGKGTV